MEMEQVVNRTSYLGGTDAAPILGLSRWKTPLQVWAQKTGLLPPEDISKKIPVKLGNKLEEIVCEMFCDETGKQVRRSKQTIFHPEYDFIGANIDRFVNGEDAGLEVKTASAWKSKEWEGQEIPQEYIFQCYHYMAVTGRQRWYIAVLIGNQDFKWKCIERDDRVINELISREVFFWREFVEKNQMPTTITKDDSDVLLSLFPLAKETVPIQLSDEANIACEMLEGLQQDLIHVEGLIMEQKNRLKSMLKDYEEGVTSRYRVTWKNRVMRRVDVEAMKEKEPLVYESYLKESSTRQLVVRKEAQNGHN